MADFLFNDAKREPTFTFVNEPEISGTIGDKSTITSDSNGYRSNFLRMDYYQRFFDIDQDQVLMRIFNSFYPRLSGNYIADYVQPNPDLYGPFWISTTLIFSIAIFGDLSTFIQNYSADAASEHIGDFTWVTAATSLVFFYVTVVPALIYFFQVYRKCDVQYRYFEILCMYGYSLSIFVPLTALWFLLPFYWLRWLTTISTVAASGCVISYALYELVRNDTNKLVSVGFIAAVLLTHLFLILCFKEYFFPLSSTQVLDTASNFDADLTKKVTEHM